MIWVLGAALGALYAADSPRDYAWGMDLTLTGPSDYYEVTIPRVVYEGVVHADLSDLRVFNAADEAVPHAFVARSAATIADPAPVGLRLYPIRTDAPEGVDAIELRVEHAPDGTVLDLRSVNGAPVNNGAKLVGYVADATALGQPLRAVRLQVPSGVADLITRVTLEASDDLRTWTALATDAPIMQFTAGINRLERRRIAFAPRRAQYLRVSWPGRARALELVALEVEASPTTQEASRQWKDMSAVAVPEKRNRYELDLGGRYPVDRLSFFLPQPNTVATLGIYSRATGLDAWRFVRNATVYRLSDEGSDVYSEDVVLDGSGDRYWRFAFDPRRTAPGPGALGVRAGWVPHRLVFAAHGAQPFVLTYGSRTAQPVAAALTALVPGYDEFGPQPQPAIGIARPEPPHEIAGESAIAEPFDWRRLLLWSSLVLSLAILAGMAFQAVRQLPKPSPPPQRPRKRAVPR